MPVGVCGRWLAEAAVGRGGAELVVLVVLVVVAPLLVSSACRGGWLNVVVGRIVLNKQVSAVLVLAWLSAVLGCRRRRRGVGEAMFGRTGLPYSLETRKGSVK